MTIEPGWRRLRRFWRPSARDEIDDEVAFHLEMRVEQYVAEGLTRDDAEHRARAQFGDVRAVSDHLVRSDQRRRWRVDVAAIVDAVGVDLRYALRSLRQHPGFTALAIGVLALGIGASTAIFSVVNAVLLRPLPYGHAEQLGVVTQDLVVRGVNDVTLAPGDIGSLRAGSTLFDGVAGVWTSINVPFGVGATPPEPVTYARATANIFRVLELPVVLGRTFTDDDGRVNEALPLVAASDGAVSDSSVRGPPPMRFPRIAIIGYDYWQRRFGGSPTALGKTVTGPWGPETIVGVASPRAELLFPAGLRVARMPDVWEASREDFVNGSHTVQAFRLVVRRRPGVDVAAARAQIDSISGAMRDAIPVRRTAGATLVYQPMKEKLISDARSPILVLMGAVACLLLIACANVANLLLVRATQRERELAIRAAIGGSGWRIVRQLLAESLVLAGAAAAIGIGLTTLSIGLLVRLAPESVPRLTDVSIDRWVLAFTLGASCLAAVVFGLVPALRAALPQLSVLLGTNSRPSVGGALRFRNLVVIAEVALSFVLIIGCGLMIRTFDALTRAPLGFDPNGVLTFTLSNRNFASPDDRRAFVRLIREHLAAIPGVENVTMASSLPFDGSTASVAFGPPSAAADEGDLRQGVPINVAPHYFELLRIPVIAGRAFTPEDDESGEPIVMIDDGTARRFFGDESAVGKTIVARYANVLRQLTVVGVVHSRHTTRVGADRPLVYFPSGFVAPSGGTWALRTSGDPAALVPSVRTAMANVHVALQSSTRASSPGSTRLIVNDPQPMTTFVDRALAPTRFVLVLIGAFAGIALVLAIIGLYGVLASLVRQRTAEIGVRIAFGAQLRDIVSMVVRYGMRLTVVGLVIGALIALSATRIMTTMLVDVRPNDPLTFAATALAFTAVALLACWLPARRAALIDPATALREGAP